MISFVLHYFHRLEILLQSIDNIKHYSNNPEIIVINDCNSNIEIISGALPSTGKQLVYNDRGELRGYKKGIEIAKYNYVCLVQDDDMPPINSMWIDEVLNFFKLDSSISVIGIHTKDIDRKQKYKPVDTYFQMYVAKCAFGPWILNKKVYFNIGGFNLDYSPHIKRGGCWYADWDYCIRCWQSGYSVFKLQTEKTFNWKRHLGLKSNQVKYNQRYIFRRKYSKYLKSDELTKLVKQKNSNNFVIMSPSELNND